MWYDVREGTRSASELSSVAGIRGDDGHGRVTRARVEACSGGPSYELDVPRASFDRSGVFLESADTGVPQGFVDRSMESMAKELRSYLVGWKNYFQLAEAPSIFQALDEWLRHRLRAVVHKQGGSTRCWWRASPGCRVRSPWWAATCNSSKVRRC